MDVVPSAVTGWPGLWFEEKGSRVNRPGYPTTPGLDSVWKLLKSAFCSQMRESFVPLQRSLSIIAFAFGMLE
jgi:hypothetical protein